MPSRFARVAQWGADHFHFGRSPGYAWYGMLLLLVWGMFWGTFMWVEATLRWVRWWGRPSLNEQLKMIMEPLQIVRAPEGSVLRCGACGAVVEVTYRGVCGACFLEGRRGRVN